MLQKVYIDTSVIRFPTIDMNLSKLTHKLAP